ncbi:hypothetical protein QFC19_006828 [Naganishia cerealis]|uniref:Uncharacterized protein n=1 Tax=Naganishia cerealis TaxID=610337 RepID=A0ACC2VD83_9TREE|nr:hypothetical protein QFC19_006828 [Naganishia cerealis]
MGEYAQVAYRQAELELRRLQEVKPTYHSPSSRSMTPFDAQRPDEFGTASMSDDECESDDAASQYTSLSRLGVLTKGLRQAMEQWKKNVDANDDKQDVPLCGGNQ